MGGPPYEVLGHTPGGLLPSQPGARLLGRGPDTLDEGVELGLALVLLHLAKPVTHTLAVGGGLGIRKRRGRGMKVEHGNLNQQDTAVETRGTGIRAWK